MLHILSLENTVIILSISSCATMHDHLIVVWYIFTHFLRCDKTFIYKIGGEVDHLVVGLELRGFFILITHLLTKVENVHTATSLKVNSLCGVFLLYVNGTAEHLVLCVRSCKADLISCLHPYCIVVHNSRISHLTRCMVLLLVVIINIYHLFYVK